MLSFKTVLKKSLHSIDVPSKAGNFKYTDLSGREDLEEILASHDTTGSTITNFTFYPPTIRQISFHKMTLRQCSFVGKKFIDCDFTGADLTTSNFQGAVFDRCLFNSKTKATVEGFSGVGGNRRFV